MAYSTTYLIHYKNGTTNGYSGNACFSGLTGTWGGKNLAANFKLEKITYFVINYSEIYDSGYDYESFYNYNQCLEHATSTERFTRTKKTLPVLTDVEITQYLETIRKLFNHPFEFQKVDDFVWQVDVPNIYGNTTSLVACLTWIRHIQEHPEVVWTVLARDCLTYSDLLNAEAFAKAGGGHGINGYGNTGTTKALNVDNLHLASIINNGDTTSLNINNTYSGKYHV